MRFGKRKTAVVHVTMRQLAQASIDGPFFLAYGLVKGACLDTEAMGSLAVYVAKALKGSSLVAGTFIAKRLGLKLDGEKFRLLMDGLLLVAGVTMLWAGLR